MAMYYSVLDGLDRRRKLPIYKRVWRKFTCVVQSHFVFCIKATSKTNTNNNDDVHGLHGHDHHRQPQASVLERKGLHFPPPPPPRHGHRLYNDRRIVSVQVEAIWDDKGNGAVAVDASDNDDDKQVSDVHNNDDVSAGESSSNSDVTEMKLEGNIDARAEEFINNFKQHLRIQRAMSAENAILDFYQMLARSA